jgi:hypothetical protein
MPCIMHHVRQYHICCCVCPQRSLTRRVPTPQLSHASSHDPCLVRESAQFVKCSSSPTTTSSADICRFSPRMRTSTPRSTRYSMRTFCACRKQRRRAKRWLLRPWTCPRRELSITLLDAVTSKKVCKISLQGMRHAHRANRRVPLVDARR